MAIAKDNNERFEMINCLNFSINIFIQLLNYSYVTQENCLFMSEIYNCKPQFIPCDMFLHLLLSITDISYK